MNKPLDNNELGKVLPDLKKEFEALNSQDFRNYEDKLSKLTGKAMDSLENIIDDGTLALDPEQLVKSVQILNKARVDIIDSKRKLLETMTRAEIMLKALEPPKDAKNDNALLEYLKANNLNTELGDTSNNSIFGEVEKCSTD